MKTGPFLLQNFFKSFWGTFGPHHTKTHRDIQREQALHTLHILLIQFDSSYRESCGKFNLKSLSIFASLSRHVPLVTCSPALAIYLKELLWLL